MRHALLPAIAVAGTLAAALGAPSAASAASTDPTGTWLTQDGRAKVRFDRCGAGNANLCGKIVWLKSPTGPGGAPRTDVKNPDPAKRSRPVMGLRLMDNLKPADGKFSGEIYNADEGKMYQVSVARESETELSISGCLLSILCGSQTWNRVPDVNQQAAVDTAAKPSPKTAKTAPAPSSASDD